MTELTWQKSSFSEAGGANCIYVAASPNTGTIHLHESDDPTVTLTTTPAPLAALIRTLTPNTPVRMT